MKNEIKNFLIKAMPDIDFTKSNTLVDDGIIDSLSIVNIIGELAVEYDIHISFDEISPENFNSIEAIASMVERIRNN